MNRHRRISAHALLLAIGVVTGMLMPAVTTAKDKVTFFEPPEARTSNLSVFWTQRFRSSTKPLRVELMTRLVGQEAWLVETMPIDELDGRDRYGASRFSGTTYPPNSRLEYRFRVTPKGGPPETGPSRIVKVEDDRIAWHDLEGDLVHLHWQTGDKAFAERALQIAEDAIARTSTLLGVTETKPIDFFVYSDPEDFQSALGPGTKEFVAGRAINEIRTLFAQILPDQIGSDWVSIVIPHELTHLVFDTATENPYHQPPHWMNEGLAVYLSEGFSDADRRRLANAVTRDALLPLTALADGFPSSREDLFYQGYAEGASAIDFFVRTYGEDKLIQLIRGYAAGVTDDEAFQAATGEGFQAFEQAWLADIGTASPAAVGPRDAPPGPTPLGWSSGVPGSTAAPSTAGGGNDQPAAPAPSGGGLPSGLLGVVGLILGLVAIALVVLGRRMAKAERETAGLAASGSMPPGDAASSDEVSLAAGDDPQSLVGPPPVDESPPTSLAAGDAAQPPLGPGPDEP